MTAAVVDTTLGGATLPSQVNTFLSCPAKWYFRYGLGGMCFNYGGWRLVA
jgi:hypothetical protein